MVPDTEIFPDRKKREEIDESNKERLRIKLEQMRISTAF